MDLTLGHTRLIIDKCRQHGLSDEQTAYVLATAFWETARTMKPVRETLAANDEQAIIRLDRAWDRGQLPWVSRPYWRRDTDGKAWFGRGFVQLTHKANYQKAARETGVDVVSDPSRMLDPEISADVLVIGMQRGWFTGKALSDYIGGGRRDYINARRVVNGTDKASEIANLAERYLAEIKAVAPMPAPKPKTRGGFWAALAALIKAIFGGKRNAEGLPDVDR